MMKHFLICSMVTIFLLLILVMLGEAGIRLYQYFQYGINPLHGANQGVHIKDKTLGWRMRENLRFQTTGKDALNKSYEIKMETFKSGFRSYGDTKGQNLKLLFIGDSYTEAIAVSNDKTYYGKIKATSEDIEVFAYGCGGYGTLQEYMILDESIDQIKPDAVILQFFWNDFLDNNNKLDMMKTLYNSGVQRPYLEEDGSISYKYSHYGNFFIRLPDFVAQNFRILTFINQRISILLNSLNHSELDDIERSGSENPEFKKSIASTRTLLQMIKSRAKQVPVFLFSISMRQPYYDEIKKICAETGVIFIDSIAKSLAERESEHRWVTKSADREHLNEEGHQIVFENLMNFLAANNTILNDLRLRNPDPLKMH